MNQVDADPGPAPFHGDQGSLVGEPPFPAGVLGREEAEPAQLRDVLDGRVGGEDLLGGAAEQEAFIEVGHEI